MSDPWVRAFVALGSNLDDPAAHLRKAFGELAGHRAVRLVARSPVYRSRPLGPAGQPDYLNAVAELQTRWDAERLLGHLQAIERRHGRQRGERWGPRTLDLDLLLYSESRIDLPHLVVPHPEMHRRAFVLIPLADLDPDLIVPGMGPLGELLAALDPNEVAGLELQA